MTSGSRNKAASSRSDLAEAIAIFAGRDFETADERASHRFARAEAARAGNRLDTLLRLLEPPPRRFDARLPDKVGGRRPDFADKDAGEIARTHRNAPRQRGNTQFGAGIIGDPSLDFAQRLAFGGLC